MKEKEVRQVRNVSAVVLAICLICSPVFGQNEFAEKKRQAASSSEAKIDGSYLNQKKEQYQKKAEEKLRRFDEKLRRLYVRVEKKGIKSKEQISGAVDDLKRQSKSAGNKLKDLKDSGVEKWEHARGELDSMLKDLERSYDRVASGFRD